MEMSDGDMWKVTATFFVPGEHRRKPSMIKQYFLSHSDTMKYAACNDNEARKEANDFVRKKKRGTDIRTQ